MTNHHLPITFAPSVSTPVRVVTPPAVKSAPADETATPAAPWPASEMITTRGLRLMMRGLI